MDKNIESHPSLKLKRLGIDTYKEAVIYMRKDCQICLSEGFESQARVKVIANNQSIIATLNIITSDILKAGDASLSEYAFNLLNAKEGDTIIVTHSKPVKSLSFVRKKIYGNILSQNEIESIIKDITDGMYSDIHLSSFLTACGGGNLNEEEVVSLTRSMVNVGEKLSWDQGIVVDKHCVGGLPGNRTTPIVVSIVAAYGLTIPKTSSRAITSPAGTADVMEVLAPVKMSVKKMKEVVNKENGCIVWGGSVSLSPADDILLRVEKALNLDSTGQLVASVLSKKIAAGSTHVLIDVPIGPTAKIRSMERAEKLKRFLDKASDELGIKIKTIFSDGLQPVGNGIGPALEASDILDVLQNKPNAPVDLKERAIHIAGHILEFSEKIKIGEGQKIAREILTSNKAFEKFNKICEAQGGIRKIPKSNYQFDYKAQKSGKVINIDNREIANTAKLAGAPIDKAAGIYLRAKLGQKINKGDTLFTIHTESKGELDYVLNYLKDETIFEIG